MKIYWEKSDGTKKAMETRDDSFSKGGRILGKIRRQLTGMIKPGLDLFEIETAARKLITDAGAVPNFVFVDNYGFATCLMVNDEVVHCRPRHYRIAEGDLITVDVGLEWHGWQLDTADSLLAGQPDDKFIKTGRQALNKAIMAVKPGNRIGNISKIIQEILEKNSYSAVRQYCGHGLGKQIHEDPQIPCYLEESVVNTPLIKPGMTLAVEVMMNEGGYKVVLDKDGWRSRTADGSRSAQFEHSILVTTSGPKILT
ncbi:type I methionyl aminopeptidase [Candidatus Collierbacteria bacterium]|nr:type I methionyl aminopeptidase [Candidatus Collierbacteria bacterium]